jgi:voltage-gated potassium channel Kch
MGYDPRAPGGPAVLARLAIAFALLAACVAIHATVLTVALRRVGPLPEIAGARVWPLLWPLIRTASWIVTAHLVEIAVWALFYTGLKVFPDAESSFYFSMVTYTTVGYGDLVPPQAWRLLAGVEGLTGILMCGWSTGFFFVIVSRFHMHGER